MKRYPIDNFYVGNLNIAFPKGNVLLQSIHAYNMTNEEKKIMDLFYRTTNEGAINLERLHMDEVISNNNSFIYKLLLTLFYRVDDNKYICLHNGNTYEENGNESFCSNLYKLSDVLPKFGYNIPKELSCLKASYLFNCLFKEKKKFPYNYDKFNINDFYFGNLDLCCGYNDINAVRSHAELNVPSQIILFKKELYNGSGYSKRINIGNDTFEADYCSFSSIYLKLDDENYYNIDNYKIYNIDKCEPFCDKVILKRALKDELPYNELGEFVTIGKVLKKQKTV